MIRVMMSVEEGGLMNQYKLRRTWFYALLLFLFLAPASLVSAQDTSEAERKSLSKQKTDREIATFKKAHGLFLKYFGERRYGEAETQVQMALKLVRKLLGSNHLITATEINNLAVLYTSTQRYGQAVPLYEEALKIRKVQLKQNDARIRGTLEDLQTALFALKQPIKEYDVLLQLLPFYDGAPPQNGKRLAFALNRLGVLLINGQKYQQARKNIERAIRLYESLHGRDHKDTAMALSNLAVIETKQKKFKVALGLFDEVYATRSALLGEGHVLTLRTLGEIAGIASELKQYDRAILVSRKIIKERSKRLGPDHIDLAGAHNRLGAYAFRAGDYDQAGRSLVRAIEITEKARGKDSPELLTYLDNLATLYKDLGRGREAAPIYRHHLFILAKQQGKSAPKVINALIHLGKLYRQVTRYEDAEDMFNTALVREEGRPDPKKTKLGAIHNNLGGLYRETGRYEQSGEEYQKALALHFTAPDAKAEDLGRLYDNMGVLNIELNKFDVAEDYHKKALAIFEETLGPEHRTVSFSLNNLATVYDYQGRFAEVLALRERSLAIYQKSAKPADPMIGIFYDNLAGSYRKSHRMEEAELHYKKAMDALLVAHGPNHPEVALAMSNLAALYGTREDYAGAERLYRKAIAINLKVYGKNHPQLANMWRLLGDNDFDRKDYASAAQHYHKALLISDQANGPEHTKTGYIVLKLARLYLWEQKYPMALANYRRAARIDELQRGKKRGDGEDVDRRGKNGVYTGLAITLWHIASNEALLTKLKEKRSALMEEGLYAAQKALRTKAGAALAQMSARFAAGSGKLAGAVRHRQDLTRRYGQLDKALLTLVGASPAKRDDQAITRLRVTIMDVGRKIAQLDKTLAKDFPEYATLANPQPLSAHQVQEQLKSDEALIYFMTSNQAVYVWAMSRGDFIWNRVPLKRRELREQVAHLRLALNPESSTTRGFTPSIPEGPAAPLESVKTSFDLAASHRLYKALLQPLQNVIGQKKHLIIVASDALTGLPFQVLVTDPPPTGGRSESEIYRQAGWLIKRHALTTLPSIASLKALRQFADKRTSPPKALIAFGDPVFSKAEKPRVLASRSGEFSSFFRGGQVNLAALSQLSQLPDTRDELINVARTLNVPLKDIRLGRAATETVVKALDRSGELAQHKVVYFATHGLISGDIKGLAEPALAMSLPTKATSEDDGLLTASEVTQLHLNADWVVLSACNTASGDKPGAEALSGLARAFFYSGAKSLLVSHWPVYSDAATLLTTKAFKLIEDGQKAGQPIGRAQALRRSMLALINKKSDSFASHPSYWAPFVVVGEGAGAGVR